MQREIEPKWLLRQASELARKPRGPGQPRNADLRLAVSAAYYAVFHALTRYAVRHLLPHGARPDQLRLARSYDHGSIAEVCRWLTGGSAPKRTAHVRPIVDGLTSNVRLADVAVAFLDLQEVRHEADYDHLASFSQIDSATSAVKNLGYLSNSHEGQLFFVLVAMQRVLK